jgi:serine/threonine-protein kinase
MQPPIPLGTLLQKRYRVTKILGQGGFGRTYLAQDTACFDELCVLKEFSPNDRSKEALKKSKELFQREAQVLYQINHPQIPKFRANFDEQKRLFLVQEYAEGKTVAKTLSERLKERQTFNEAEAVEFLHQMLPVLSYIHGMGIIHRDISPDNIIFRDRDKLPVLIDFGVVKDGVTQLEVSTEVHQGTTVGKAGYAPNEQLQTGEAYANSDLYALAVTVVVMMTGRKPESLIDKSTMNWKWHQWVPTLSPWFAKILNKMLSRVPSNRYQSATEVAQALRAVSDFVGNSTTSGYPGTPTTTGGNSLVSGYANGSTPTTSQNPSVPLSRVGKTTGIHQNNPTSTNRPVLRSYYSSQENNNSSSNSLSNILKTPWGMATLAGGVVLVFIILPFFLFLRSMAPSKIDLPTPKTTVTPTPLATTAPESTPSPVTSPTVPEGATPTPTAPTPTSIESPSAPESLSVEVGKLVEKEATLNPNQAVVYSLNLEPGKQLAIELEANPPGATMNFLAPNNVPVDYKAQNIVKWEGLTPIAGEYRVQIVPPATATNSTNYKLKVTASQGATTP